MTQNLTPVETVAQRVRELRKAQGWSAETLAAEMTKAGMPWDRSIVANLENGRRRGVDVGELLALAYVLNCPPLLLMAPLGADVRVAVTPEVTADPYELYGWMVGDHRVRTDNLQPGRARGGLAHWKQAALPTSLYWRFTHAGEEVAHKHEDLRMAERAGDATRKATAEGVYLHALRGLATVLNEMHEAGMTTLPPMPQQWLDDARELGMLRTDEPGE